MAGFFRKFQESQRPFCTALVAAAGASERMKCGGSKLLLPLDGVPVFALTMQALERAGRVDAIVVAAREEDILPFSDLCRTYGITKPVKIICGGASRTESVLRAALEADQRTRLLAVHDGARPLAAPELIDAVIQKAARCGAAAPFVPMKDTVKIAADGKIQSTPDRRTLVAVQTPQVFEADLLKAALQAVLQAGGTVTDDCAAVERLGKIVYLTEGSEENIKITTPLDLAVAETILEERRDGCDKPAGRTGV
ncbi:MAG: 2-C-methyl-D-erythritol 4-phosphate cytidylyltransferase [Oscillibacter sp.]|jgi:2-C-methyl-D-erythritol 4-phosphate cytidylyltransferase|nr:2-C-methyl-D-erythritol 4-phosphate cytidylyltransferase [Oscillibacter sp.]